MRGSWTFGQKIGAGFTLALIFTLVIAVVAIWSLRTVVADKDVVIETNAVNRLDGEMLNAAAESKVAASRGFLLTGDETHVENMRAARASFYAALERIGERSTSAEGNRLLAEIEKRETEHEQVLQDLLRERRANAALGPIIERFDRESVPLRLALARAVETFAAREQRLLDTAQDAASDTASAATTLVTVLASVAGLLALITATVLTRALSQQIGAAVQHVQSSSSELQTAANQQASGAKEQSVAMNEITTTINELLSTSKQIASSAQRVAQIAEDTAKAARAGEQTVGKTGDSMGAITRQVDLIVTHMLDLGKKSQQIGGILELINELAEQTNILAINATIEAAGAGDAGKRFAVVADEIRKLADRVAGSTKEIRGLIDEIRAAVNTTVMTTEGGTKAVDAGARHFVDLASALEQIAGAVRTTSEAAREIELSTKQQSTAVEQVNVAIANVAQATKETEAGAVQTLQTASQLAVLSTDLTRLIRPRASA